MPSIEIACLDLQIPARPRRTSFELVYEAGLKSHRFPSRFQSHFDNFTGCLYHIGNPNLSEASAFFAYDVLSVASQDCDSNFFEFSDAHATDGRYVLDLLLSQSPSKSIIFTTDWQFGPEHTLYFELRSLQEFWRLHDSRKLILNAAYTIRYGALGDDTFESTVE